MNFSCTSCKSDNVQRLSVIYEGGLSDVNTKSKGTAIGFGRGGIGVGVGASKTTGTSQTAASQRAAPPPKKRFLKPLAWIFVPFLIMTVVVGKSYVGEIILNVAWLAASLGWIIHAFQYNAKKWPLLKATWDNSYLCNRCNEISVVGS